MLADFMILGGATLILGSATVTLDWLLGMPWVPRQEQSLLVQEIVPPLPDLKWTREDAAKSAEMYRKVPSAFWLAPEYTRFDGPAEPAWGAPVYASVAEPRSPIFRSLVGGYWRGRKIIGVRRDIMRDGYMLRLEGDDHAQESVFLTARDMQDTMMHYGY